jgi:peptidoglycan hydrolase-like protein with peptidoglycan-binding domain
VALEEGLAGGTVESGGATDAAEAVQAGEHDDAGGPAEAEAKTVEAEDSAAEAEPEDVAEPENESGPGDGDLDETAGTGEPDEAAAPAVPTEALPIIEPVAEVEPAVAEPVAAAEPAEAEPAEAKPAVAEPVAEPVSVPEPVAVAEPAAAVPLAAPAGGRRRRLSWKIATAVSATAAILIASVVVAATSSTAASPKASHHAKAKTEALTVLSVTPANGATSVNGAAPITVTYSGPIAKSTPLPTLSPNIPGSWQVSKDKAVFTPQVGFRQNTHVTVNVPAPAGTVTAAATSYSFTTGQYSTVRLDQILSQLGYIPVTWTPTDPSGDVPATDANAQLSAAYDPPAGTFTFDSGYPAALTRQWSVGTSNEITDGAIRTFEFDHGMNMDGIAGPHVWAHLFTAIARNQQSQHGYTYVWVTQAGTEHLKLYHNGHVAITSLVNTGIPASPTADGTYPVYLRYTVTQMQGLNPNGTPYNDTVYWVSYFNGGDAVHAFPRGGYGWYQSLGCVELPYDGSGPGVAENVWNLITYGTLVTVTGPVA